MEVRRGKSFLRIDNDGFDVVDIGGGLFSCLIGGKKGVREGKAGMVGNKKVRTRREFEIEGALGV